MRILGIILLLISMTVTAADRKKVTRETSANAINAAVEAYKEVDKLGFSWSNTYSDKIGPAKLLWQQGKYRRAQQLANDALEQIKSAREQHEASLNYGLKSN